MSEDQLTALLAKLKDDAGLREKLQSAPDLDAALALAKEAGFDVGKPEWLRYQASQTSAIRSWRGLQATRAPLRVRHVTFAAFDLPLLLLNLQKLIYNTMKPRSPSSSIPKGFYLFNSLYRAPRIISAFQRLYEHAKDANEAAEKKILYRLMTRSL